MIEIKKLLAVSIILLFIGVSLAPSINQNVVTASQEEDFVEVTSQACGINGYGDTTVKLTREQYQNLEQYLVEFRARLNQTTTREEAVPLFKEAVVELDTYGLLPRGMSVEKAQKLVVGRFQNERLMKLIERIYANNQKDMWFGTNLFCLVFGFTSNTYFIGVPLFPVKLFSIIIVGVLFSEIFVHYEENHFAQGVIKSIGLLGYEQMSGSRLTGELFKIRIRPRWYLRVGAIGFTGLRFGFNGNYLYFGSAVILSVHE